MKIFTIRRAELLDLPVIVELASQVWYVTYGEMHSREQLEYMFEQMYRLENLEKQLTEGHVFFIGYEGSNRIGYFSVQQKETDLFYLQKLYVLPEYQGTGAGKFLFLSAVCYIKEIHPSPCNLQLNVNRQNKAIRFYEYMGMEVIAESDEEIGNGFVMNNCYMCKMI